MLRFSIIGVGVGVGVGVWISSRVKEDVALMFFRGFELVSSPRQLTKILKYFF